MSDEEEQSFGEDNMEEEEKDEPIQMGTFVFPDGSKYAGGFTMNEDKLRPVEKNHPP